MEASRKQMIDIVAEETTCKACGKSLIQAKRQGPHKREYCNDTCRQRAHRAKKQQKRETPEARIATLEMEIAALEVEIRRLQERLNVEQRFRTDTQVRHFKSWLRRNAQPRDTDFFKRFQADTRLPQHTSRSRYAAFLHLYHYSEEDIYLFEEAWKDMMFLQS
jgi:septal ring factor EnvC (AmiA/AmiB activator)